MNRHTDEQREEGRWFFALSDPTRLAILRALATRKGQSSTELAVAVGLQALGAVHHLNKLERAGLVMTERDGHTRRCSLADAKVTKTAIEFSHPSGRKAIVPRA